MEAWLQNLCKGPLSKSELHRGRPDSLGLMVVPQPAELFPDCQMTMIILTKCVRACVRACVGQGESRYQQKKKKKKSPP